MTRFDEIEEKERRIFGGKSAGINLKGKEKEERSGLA